VVRTCDDVILVEQLRYFDPFAFSIAVRVVPIKRYKLTLLGFVSDLGEGAVNLNVIYER
jgi:hypothetical protein